MITLSHEQQDVLAFQCKFNIPIAPQPAFLDDEAEQYRIKFLQEELDEFKEACAEHDLPKAVDALVDLCYVLHGTALMMGLQLKWPELWNEVQRANMTKERATSSEQSKRKSTLDVIKPPGWTAPNHAKLIGYGPYPMYETSTRALHNEHI